MLGGECPPGRRAQGCAQVSPILPASLQGGASPGLRVAQGEESQPGAGGRGWGSRGPLFALLSTRVPLEKAREGRTGKAEGDDSRVVFNQLVRRKMKLKLSRKSGEINTLSALITWPHSSPGLSQDQPKAASSGGAGWVGSIHPALPKRILTVSAAADGAARCQRHSPEGESTCKASRASGFILKL